MDKVFRVITGPYKRNIFHLLEDYIEVLKYSPQLSNNWIGRFGIRNQTLVQLKEIGKTLKQANLIP